jgi:hypothetical protein
MAGNNFPVFIDQKRRVKTKRVDTFGDDAHLSPVMFARVVEGRDQVADRKQRDLPAVRIRSIARLG